MICSNGVHVIDVEGDQLRRWFFIHPIPELEEIRLSDPQKLREIIDSMLDPEAIRAVARYLYEFDLTDYNHRAPPVTEDIYTQVLNSVTPVQRFVFNTVETAYWWVSGAYDTTDQTGQVIKSDKMAEEVFDEYKRVSGDKYMILGNFTAELAKFGITKVRRGKTKIPHYVAPSRETIEETLIKMFHLPAGYFGDG